MQKLIVEPKFNNKKLSSFLYAHFNGLSYATLHKELRKNDILINDVRINEDLYVHEFDNVTIYIVDDLLYKTFDIKTVFEDDNILVVYKPAELEVVDSSFGDSLTTILSKKYSFIKPCHRLDRNTKGLVLFAKNDDTLDILFNKFKSKEIRKFYRCDVVGIMPKKQELLKAYLFKDNKKALVYISDVPKKGYLEILTKYTVISEDIKNNFSTLEVELITGRTHQIRAHLSHIGHPIIGDGKYGINEINKRFGVKFQKLEDYKLVFEFTTDSGLLNYLNGKVIEYK